MNKNICCLLIGNSRWHWALKKKEQWEFLDTSPNSQIIDSHQYTLIKWASVGVPPKSLELKLSTEIRAKDVPLLKMPEWIGVDRALAGWSAFTKAKSQNIHSKGVLIADAGTILSLTCISSKGEFIGGQLVPGLSLQRYSMAENTVNLNNPQKQFLPTEIFPTSTSEAMLRGSFQSLLGTICEAQKDSNMPIWLCGGDSLILFKRLQKRGLKVNHYPNLALEGMLELLKC